MVAVAAAGVAAATVGAAALTLRSGPVPTSVPSAAVGAQALLLSAPSQPTPALAGVPGTATGAPTLPSAVPTPRTPHRERATSASRDLAPARGTTRASAASHTTSRTSTRATTSSAKPSSRPSSPTPSTTTTTKAPSGGSSSTYEAQLLSLVNAERTSRGLSALRAASCPDRFAESWASHLSSTGAFSHQSLGPIMSSCGATMAAENIARGGISASAMVSMWMGSSGHRANILDPKLTQVGTAAVRDSSGTWTAVQDFIRP